MHLRELPPTAGLPLKWQDFLPSKPGQKSFENSLADFLNVPSVQVECSGTACFVVALETLKRLSQRRDVIIPAYTCPLVPMAVRKAGLNIKLCDTQRDSFDFDVDMLARLCDENTLCVVATHLGGLVGDLQPVISLAKHSGAWVIEDVAHALGATWQGRKVGTIGDLGFFSFAAGKGLTLFEGGALVARDPALQQALQQTSNELISFDISWECLRVAQLLGYLAFYNPLGLTFAYGRPMRHWLKKGDPVNAAGEHFTGIPMHKVGSWRKQVGLSALQRLSTQIAANAERGRRRASILRQIDGLKILDELPSTSGTWPAIMVAFDSTLMCQRALDRLWTSGLGVAKLFVHDITSYDYLQNILPQAQVPNARRLAERSLTISNSEWVTEDDFDGIVRSLKQATSTRAKVKEFASSGNP